MTLISSSSTGKQIKLNQEEMLPDQRKKRPFLNFEEDFYLILNVEIPTRKKNIFDLFVCLCKGGGNMNFFFTGHSDHITEIALHQLSKHIGNRNHVAGVDTY